MQRTSEIPGLSKYLVENKSIKKQWYVTDDEIVVSTFNGECNHTRVSPLFDSEEEAENWAAARYS